MNNDKHFWWICAGIIVRLKLLKIEEILHKLQFKLDLSAEISIKSWPTWPSPALNHKSKSIPRSKVFPVSPYFPFACSLMLSLDLMRADFLDYACLPLPDFSLPMPPPLDRPFIPPLISCKQPCPPLAALSQLCFSPPRSPPQPLRSLHAQSGQRAQAGESAAISTTCCWPIFYQNTEPPCRQA